MDSQTLNAIIYAVLQSRVPKRTAIQTLIAIETLQDLLRAVHPILVAEPILLSLSGDIYVVGDIHGNIDDLLRIFEQSGYPPQSTYLFLGDYVDRGLFGIEVMALLFALKCKFPQHIYLLRGNHETQVISQSYGFLTECQKKFSPILFTEFNVVWTALPIAAVLNDTIFCVHGGISPCLKTLDQFSRLPKPSETLGGLFNALLWSDPSQKVVDFGVSTRGTGFLFGESALNHFLDDNALTTLVRSHELVSSGMTWCFPNCVTVFSNSDYTGRRNDGAVLHVSADCQFARLEVPCLAPDVRAGRRVIFPAWLIEASAEGKSPDSGSDADSQPEDQASEIELDVDDGNWVILVISAD
jgi:diadenosine tetraphosphatase ApaH/serine/threonine PP2A family protein phosphatase